VHQQLLRLRLLSECESSGKNQEYASGTHGNKNSVARYINDRAAEDLAPCWQSLLRISYATEAQCAGAVVTRRHQQ
jgi:hypothetical protein